MNRRFIVQTLVAFSVVAALASTGSHARVQEKTEIKDQIEQSEKAARVFREIMDIPDQAIPQTILDSAECVAVFPPS